MANLKRLDQTLAWIAALGMGWVCWVMATHALAAFPSSDDWNAGVQAQGRGLWGAFVYFYTVHHGRYVLNFVWPWIMSDPELLLFKYRFATFFLHLVLLSGFLYAMRQFAPRLNRSHSLAGAAAFAVYFYTLPFALGEVFYILSGAMHYLGGYGATVWALASARHASRMRRGWPRRGVLAVCCLAVFVAMGSSEATVVLALFLMGCLVVLDVLQKERFDRGLWAAPIAVAGIGLGIALGSPAHGTNTHAQLAQSRDWIRLLLEVRGDFHYFVLNHVLRANFIALASVWIPLFLLGREPGKSKHLGVKWAMVGLGWGAILLVLFLPRYFYGFATYNRTAVILFLYCAVLVGAMAALTWDTVLFYKSRWAPHLRRSLSVLQSGAWMIVVILLGRALHMRWQEIPFQIHGSKEITQAYKSSRENLLAELKKAAANPKMRVDPPAKFPKPPYLGYCEVGEGDCHSYTWAFAGYFKIQQEQINIDPGVRIR